MNYLFYGQVLFLFLQTKSSIIKSPSVPLCKNCVFFKPYNYLDSKEDDYKYSLGKCERFYRISEIDGSPVYSHAFLCRSDESLCGYNGNQYKERTENTFQE